MQDAASKFITGFLDIPEVCRLINQAKTSTSTASVAPSTDGGASPSQKTAAPITNVEALPAQKTLSELRVGADPYYSNKQKEMFGEDLSRTGLLPIMVYLQNKGEQPLKVNPNLISLEFQAGGEVKPWSSLPSALLPEPHLSDTTGAKVGRVFAGIAATALVIIVVPNWRPITSRHCTAIGEQAQTPEGIPRQRATGDDFSQG